MSRRTARILVVGGALLLAGLGTATAAAVSWQESQAGAFQLGVRDKYGTLGHYQALFTVTDGQHEWQHTVTVDGDEWGFALFPDEFQGNAYAAPGKSYRWQAKVGGQTAVQGSFTLP